MEDTPNTLEKLVNSSKQEDKESPNRSWIGGLVAGIAVLILTAVFGFIAWKRGRKMAELLHKEALAEEALRRAEVDATLKENSDAREEFFLEIHHLQLDRDALRAERIQNEQKYLENRKRLADITSWDNVDSYLGRPRPTLDEVPGSPVDPD